VATAVILPLVAFVRTERRAEHVRSLLRLAAPGGSPRLAVVALAAVAVLVGIAAAQPVIERFDAERAKALQIPIAAWRVLQAGDPVELSIGDGIPLAGGAKYVEVRGHVRGQLLYLVAEQVFDEVAVLIPRHDTGGQDAAGVAFHGVLSAASKLAG